MTGLRFISQINKLRPLRRGRELTNSQYEEALELMTKCHLVLKINPQNMLDGTMAGVTHNTSTTIYITDWPGDSFYNTQMSCLVKGKS